MKINREKTFFDILYSTQAFLNNENVGFKNQKIWNLFQEGLVFGFGQKIWNFFNVSFYAKYTQIKYVVTLSLEKKLFYVI